jgi:hypothetical protein
MKRILLFLMIILISGSNLFSEDSGNMSSDEIVYDRVCIKDSAKLYTKPDRSDIKGKVDFWTFASYLKTDETGIELVLLENGDEVWVERNDFYPVYRIIGDADVEYYEVYFTEEQLKKKKPGGKPGGIRVKDLIPPGELVGGIPIAQAPAGTIQVIRGDNTYGYINAKNLILVGEPGWGMDEFNGLELLEP